MKLVALHDADGKILAASRVRDGEPGPVPVAGPDTHVVTVEVPYAHRELKLMDICTRLRVDPTTCELVEHPSKP
jgi:hypothetical protein